jgi:hypothetical protein
MARGKYYNTCPRMPCCSLSPHNAVHVRNALILGSALRLALAQAIILTDLLRPQGASIPTPHAALASPATEKQGSKRV